MILIITIREKHISQFKEVYAKYQINKKTMKHH